MASQTTNLKMTKPDYTDSVDVKVLNDNFDILDNKIQGIYGKIGGASASDTKQNVTIPSAAAVGTINKPVYVDATGTIKECSDLLVIDSGLSTEFFVSAEKGYGEIELTNPGSYTKALVCLWSSTAKQMLPFTTVFSDLGNVDTDFVSVTYLGYPGNDKEGLLSRKHETGKNFKLRLEPTCAAQNMKCYVKVVWLP